MNLHKAFKECKAYFPRLRKVRLSLQNVTGDFADWYGLYMAGWYGSDLICLNIALLDLKDEAFVRAVMIHELIHCEQWTNNTNPSHGAYFQHRVAELRELTGLPIPTGL